MNRRSEPRSPGCRVGFVGTGGVAVRHATVLAGFDDAVLVSATDADPARAVAFATTFGTDAAPDVDALLAHGLDAVYVCVPPFAHGPIEERLADAGVAVFVEKPPAVDEPTAERLAAGFTAAGTTTRVGLHWRVGEPALRARALLEGRTVRVVSGRWLDTLPPVPWWGDPARSGGQVVEQAVHVLDLARFLVGEVAEVQAFAGGPVEGGGVDVATAAVLRFAGGAVGTLATTCALDRKDSAALQIVTDDLVLDVGERRLEVRENGATTHRPFDPATAHRAADRAFLDAVAGHPPADDLPDHAEALRSHRLACAVSRSARSGRPERVHP
ncbi:Gfo/Idh/MocA family oxidoreductase [Pseudonocardia sp. KRD-184]|uniref:Gfo/Idh/MocA family oxidoreductase n=1 Tax=Pseudonocardia oceani TaxID=2792013 RepID=A0ABS6UGJ8_9PSEU|nr:Gfo/Idh/MocA family oxidoreductase [Pseudonocardia oceani]MBW0088097.1 Gfo/Idh/MocA family oxidoreductase [Pseudonocardia oceani]MBW0094710.1 Gfo/Idh/MocA family oxidoreductase [Pseudonocardia oceani]MBW0107308.1 Gfo/Idh/MocA family oxidoreductase [Pseudonocardia oceani]MBW0120402.1 Gfo/Idh/MocA family oxidoreductase [Pseudonocardia oceani]MBW0131344.1 Gfo/Idh/MocA family oxidoreductase [Pseudonocardia oceani]